MQALSAEDLDIIVELTKTEQLKDIAEKFETTSCELKNFLDNNGYSPIEIKREYVESFIEANYRKMNLTQMRIELGVSIYRFGVGMAKVLKRNPNLMRFKPFDEGDDKILSELVLSLPVKALAKKWEVTEYVMCDYLDSKKIRYE